MLIAHDMPLVDEIDMIGLVPKKRASPERAIQRAGIQWLRAVFPGGLFAAVVNEQRGSGATAAQRARYGAARKASGVVTGFFDTIGLIPGPSTLLIEWKAPGGVVSEAQQRVHAQARALGHVVIVADGLESLRYGLHVHQIRYHENADALARPPAIRFAKCATPADLVPF